MGGTLAVTLTLSRAYDAVRFRDTDEGQHQRDVLRQFEKASGRKRSAIVADLDDGINVGHDQYRRYLRGDTPLRWDQISVFAQAFRASTAELTRALGLLDDDPDPALVRRATEAVGPELAPQMADAIAEIARTLAGQPPEVRDDILDQIKNEMSLRTSDVTA